MHNNNNFSECFSCVGCEKDLSHDQFIMADDKTIFCSDCHAKKKAFRCTTCKKPIVPEKGQTTAPRLRALGKDYHPDCFKCQVRTYIKGPIIYFFDGRSPSRHK